MKNWKQFPKNEFIKIETNIILFKIREEVLSFEDIPIEKEVNSIDNTIDLILLLQNDIVLGYLISFSNEFSPCVFTSKLISIRETKKNSSIMVKSYDRIYFDSLILIIKNVFKDNSIGYIISLKG